MSDQELNLNHPESEELNKPSRPAKKNRRREIDHDDDDKDTNVVIVEPPVKEPEIVVEEVKPEPVLEKIEIKPTVVKETDPKDEAIRLYGLRRLKAQKLRR